MEDIRSKAVRFSNRVSKKIDTTKKMKTVRNIGDLTRDSLRLIDITVLMITQGTMNIVCRSSSRDYSRRGQENFLKSKDHQMPHQLFWMKNKIQKLTTRFSTDLPREGLKIN